MTDPSHERLAIQELMDTGVKTEIEEQWKSKSITSM